MERFENILKLCKEIIGQVNNPYALFALAILVVFGILFFIHRKPSVEEPSGESLEHLNRSTNSNTIIVNGKKNEVKNINQGQGGKFNEK